MVLLNGLGGTAGFGEQSLPRNDDGSTNAIDLSEVFPNGLNFFGELYTEAFINTNGSITFDGPLSAFTPTAISSGVTPGIFAFWADVDTRGGAIDVGVPDSAQGNSQGTNLVYYDLDQSAGALTVTWDDVRYYSSNTDRTNSFQLILTDVSDEEGRSPGDFEITYNYEDIQWTTGDASGGTDGLGGTPARIGYSAGNDSGTFFEFDVSGNIDALLALGNSDPRTFLSTSDGISADVSIDLPADLNAGINEDAGVVVEYGTDNASLIAVTVEGGLVGDPLSGGLGGATLLLGLGGQAGTSEAFDLAIRGTAGPRTTVTATASRLDGETEIDIGAQVQDLLPAYTSSEVADALATALAARLGTTVASFADGLAVYATQLGALGVNTSSAAAALAFAVEEAGDFGSLAERFSSGSLGQGWATLADLGLRLDEGSAELSGLADPVALRALSIDLAALYTVSASADRTVTLGGDVVGAGAPPRPSFVRRDDGGFDTVGGFEGTLRETSDGFEISLPDGGQMLFDADGAFLGLELADEQRIDPQRDADGLLTGLAGPNGTQLTFGRDASGRLTDVTDADGDTLTFAYDADGRLASVAGDDGTAAFAYDADGNLTAATAPGDVEAAFGYDAAGRLASASYGGGLQTETFAYGTAGQLTITDGAGRQTEVDLLPGAVAARLSDGAGGIAQLMFAEDGRLTGLQAPDGTETGLAFDDDGRLTTITDANGAVLTFGYGNADERPETFTDAGGATRGFDYDAGGRITQATWPDGTTLDFDYDASGNLTGYTNRRGDGIDYAYDARGRLISQSEGSSGAATYAYDAEGRLTSVTDDRGTTTLSYDTADRVTRIEDASGRSLSYTYNDRGLRSSISDGEGYEVFYDYDPLGRLTALRDGDGLVTGYSYDAGGNLIREENGNGTATTYAYDAAGRLTVIENLDADGAVASRLAYSYDAAGQRTGLETSDGAWTYGYDAVGQLTSASFVSTNPEIPDTEIAYAYDAAGNRTSVTRDGVETVYEANELNQYTRVGDATFAYDADGNMVSRTDPSGTTTYAYDLENRLTGVTQPDGTVLEFGYDAFGNRVSVTEDGVETEHLVDPFGLGDVVGSFEGGARVASYAHGLGLAGGEIDGQDVWFDADAVGSVTGVTGTGGALVNRYAYTPFGEELFELEGVANPFEFNGALGVMEDTDDLHFMRAREYSAELGRFLGEDPQVFGDGESLSRFAYNSPTEFSDPNGELPIIPIIVWTGRAITAAEAYGGLREAYDYYQHGRSDLAWEQVIKTGESIARGLIFDRLAGDIAKGLIRNDVWNGFLDPARYDDVSDAVGRAAGILDDFLNSNVRDHFLEDFADWIEDDENDRIDSDDSDSSSTDDSDSASSDGDPHLSTFDGVGYSFQAVGEFTLIQGDDFEIQVRQSQFGSSTQVSINEAVAMDVGGAVVGVYAGDDPRLLIDGVRVEMEAGQSIAAGDGSVYFSGSNYVVTDDAGNGFWARAGSFINLRPFIAEDAEITGLLGNANGDRTDDLQLRDGTVLTQPVAAALLYAEYADSWRIAQADSLFVYGDGEDTETFTDRSFPSTVIRIDDLDPDARALGEAAALEAGLTPGTFAFETTVIDVALTGDETFAEALGNAPVLEEEPEEVAPITVIGTADGTGPIEGSDEGETLQGTRDADVILARGGNDVVIGRGGADTITLGAGFDRVEGAVADFFGDTVTDFGEADEFVFTDLVLDRSAVTFTAASGALDIDADGDGTSDGSVTLGGDFSGGDFMAVAFEGDTTLTFDTLLPMLQERQAVDPDLVNGIVNQNYLRGDGATDFQVTLRDLGFAGYDNVLGVYEVTSAGDIVDARLLIENANANKSAEVTITDVEAGNTLGFFIVQDAADWALALNDGDVFEFVDDTGAPASVEDGDVVRLAVNGVVADETVFHSFAENLNVDGVQHALSGVDVGGESITVGFEDLTGGGDRDYEDVAFQVLRVDADSLLIA